MSEKEHEKLKAEQEAREKVNAVRKQASQQMIGLSLLPGVAILLVNGAG